MADAVEFHLYTIVKDDIVIYVGITHDPTTRQRRHRKRFGQVDLHTVQILPTIEAARAAEKVLISAMKADSVELSNKNGGGGGPETHSEATREVLSQCAKGRPQSAETRAKRSESMKGKQNAKGYKHTDEWKAALSARLMGNTHMAGKSPSPETRAKISQSMKDHHARKR